MKTGKDRMLNSILRKCIDSKGIKLNVISKGTKIKYSTIICYLSKNQTIPFYDLKAICDFTGINEGYIYQRYKEEMERLKLI